MNIRTFSKTNWFNLFEQHDKSSPFISTHYVVLYPQNGDRIVTIDFVTSLHPVYFASAAVAVHSSQMTASSSASWSRFSPPSNFVNGHVSTSRCWSSFVGCRQDVTHFCCWVPAPAARRPQRARSYRSIFPARTALSSKPAGHRCCCRSMGQTDGQREGGKPDRYVYPSHTVGGVA